MKKYNWNEKLITSYRLDPYIAPEFECAFAFLDNKSDTSDEKLKPMQVISRNISFLANNPFIYSVFDKIVTPDRQYLYSNPRGPKISVEEALRLMHFFYANTNEEIYNHFLPTFENRYSHLMVVPANKKTQASGYSGHCYCSPTARDTLIAIINTSNYETLSVFVHEYAHSLAFSLRDFELDSEDNITFSEVESLFMELVAADWFAKNSDYQKEAIKEMKNFYNEILDCARLFLEVSDVCDMVGNMHKNQKRVNFSSVIAQARKDFNDMKASYLKRILAKPLEYDTPYGYSGLIAIELYQIYLQDPNAAFDIYKRIISSNKKTATETNLVIEQIGITAGEHLDDFARSLKR